MAVLDAISAEVEMTVGIEASAVTLLQGLSQQIKDLVAAGADPVKLTALADELHASSTALAEAITENTPAP